MKPSQRKLALVTGANRGIGLAIARALAAQRFDLIITGRDSRTLAKASRELAKLGVEVLAETCDVRDPHSVDYLFSVIRGLRRPLNLLVNNAGIAHTNRGITDLPYPKWCEVIDTNLNGMFLVTQAPRRKLMPAESVARAVVDALLLASIATVEKLVVMPTGGALWLMPQRIPL